MEGVLPAESIKLLSPPSASQGVEVTAVSLDGPKDPSGWFKPGKVKEYTLIHVVDKERGRCLLGMKKRGMGVGLWNGFGGKVEPGETALSGAIRELQEESSLHATSIHPRGRLLFCSSAPFEREGEMVTPLVHLFVCDEWEGEPGESEEMRPEWFQLPSNPNAEDSSASEPDNEDLSPIPFHQMWTEAKYYLPALLASPVGRQMFGQADYGSEEGEAGLRRRGFWLMD